MRRLPISTSQWFTASSRRGNDRRKIFHSHDDYLRFTSILAQQKLKLPFYLYAYCLMPNHLHVLTEMQDDPISRIMQRVLTGYSQYHNRKYKKIGSGRESTCIWESWFDTFT